MQEYSIFMRLAIDGGVPVRKTILPYSRQQISEQDIATVTDVLRSDWLTTGPKVEEFEEAFAAFTGARYAVAVSNGTAALHAAMNAIGIRAGDEVIVCTMTFAATANAVLFCGGIPVLVDCDPDTLLIDPKAVERAITKKTVAICAIDYAGQPCDYESLHSIATQHKLVLLADACHALGGIYQHHPVGCLADLSTFSFHPVKPLTTGEGGMITTDNELLASRMRQFRNHSSTSDHRRRHEEGSWYYEIKDLGWNYRLTDFQCALGLSQLQMVPGWTRRRQDIAEQYNAAFNSCPAIQPLSSRDGLSHAYHLYVMRLYRQKSRVDRSQFFQALRAEGIGVNVHYIPVHLHPFYRETLHTKLGQCPVAEEAYKDIMSLPIFAGMTDRDVHDVIEAVTKICDAYGCS